MSDPSKVRRPDQPCAAPETRIGPIEAFGFIEVRDGIYRMSIALTARPAIRRSRAQR